jgi:signal transduction histidine kinase
MKEIAAGDEVFETLLTEGEVYVPMDIGPAIRRWAEPYRRPLADKGIALVVDIPEGIHFTAIVDCKLLKILVDNLLQNAVKYTDYGSVAVRLSMGSMELGRSGGDHRSGIILEVSDTGIGIPEGDMEHVFLRGARASNVLNQRPGTGKGLWIVGLIARCMSGGYQVSSHEREGSTFRILIPPLQPAGPDKDLPVQSNSDTHIGLLRRSS